MTRLSIPGSRSRPARLRELILVIALVALMAPAGWIEASAPAQQGNARPADYELMIRSGSRSARPLADNGVVRGDASIFVAPAEGIARVRYFLDPPADALEAPTVAGEPFAIADKPPFALERQGRFDTRTLADGPHTLVAAIELNDGRVLFTERALAGRERGSRSHLRCRAAEVLRAPGGPDRAPASPLDQYGGLRPL